MLETIISWLIASIGSALSGIVEGLLKLLQMDLRTYVETFPLLARAYTIFQTFAVVLVLFISALGLYQFFTDSKMSETPVSILVKAALATALIQFGGYILQYIVEIAKIPYDLFTSMNTSQTPGDSELAAGFKAIIGILGATSVFASADISNAGALLISLILILLIGWNLIKLILEVYERYLMVGLLVYTSPVFYPTLISPATSHIFRSWVSMFNGSAIIMFVSSFFLKLILSGFDYTASIDWEESAGLSGWMLVQRLVLILALCKIAQRADTYMQQLGIGVATTGQNMLDDFMMAGHAISRALGSGGSKGNRDSTLGDSTRAFGIPGAVIGAYRGARTAMYNSAEAGVGASGTLRNILAGAGQGAVKGFGLGAGAVGNGIIEAHKASKAGASNVEQAEAFRQGMADASKTRVGQAFAQSMRGQTAARIATQDALLSENRDARENLAQQYRARPGTGETPDISDKTGRPTASDSLKYFRNNGMPDTPLVNSTGGVTTSEKANLTGLTLEGGTGNPNDPLRFTAMDGEVVTAATARAIQQNPFPKGSMAEEERNAVIGNTINAMSPAAVEQMLADPRNGDLHLSDEHGAAAIQKAFGDLVPEGAQISNVHAVNQGDRSIDHNQVYGGREISFDTKMPDGTTRHTSISDAAESSAKALEDLHRGAEPTVQSYTSRGGNQYTVRTEPVQQDSVGHVFSQAAIEAEPSTGAATIAGSAGIAGTAAEYQSIPSVSPASVDIVSGPGPHIAADSSEASGLSAEGPSAPVLAHAEAASELPVSPEMDSSPAPSLGTDVVAPATANDQPQDVPSTVANNEPVPVPGTFEEAPFSSAVVHESAPIADASPAPAAAVDVVAVPVSAEAQEASFVTPSVEYVAAPEAQSIAEVVEVPNESSTAPVIISGEEAPAATIVTHAASQETKKEEETVSPASSGTYADSARSEERREQASPDPDLYIDHGEEPPFNLADFTQSDDAKDDVYAPAEDAADARRRGETKANRRTAREDEWGEHEPRNKDKNHRRR